MLPPVDELQRVKVAQAAVIQKLVFVTLKDDYRSASNPLPLCRLV